VDDFQRAMAIVISVGAVIVAGGTALLFLVFRAFGGAHHGERKPIVLMAVLITFVGICIAAILYFT
jgi:hypothetical protein